MKYTLKHGEFVIGTIDDMTNDIETDTEFCKKVMESFIRVQCYRIDPIRDHFGITHYEVVYV